MFKTDIAKHKDTFAKDGYIYLKDVLSDEFKAHLKTFMTEIKEGRVNDLEKNRFPGHKKQYLFDFPSQEDAMEYRKALCALSGLDPEKAVLSERHLMIYEGSSKPYPYPHKDRAASGLTVGFPTELTDETAVYVFPEMNREENLNEKAQYLNELDFKEASEAYEQADAVRIDQEIGDMIVFMGSTLYHARLKPAGTATLYCKMNDIGRDPLGENIFAEEVAG